MIRYLVVGARRSAARAVTLHLLTVVGVALGVASVLSIQVLNGNALAAFWGSVQAVSGEADLSVIGRTPTFDERALATVLATPGVARARPLYRVGVSLDGTDDVFLEIVGADLFQPANIPFEGSVDDASTVLTTPGWIAISPALAEQYGWEVGDSIAATSGSRRVSLQIGALVDFRRLTPLASSRLAVMDIAQAQSLFGERGAISQIDIALAPTADASGVTDRLRRNLGAAVTVQTQTERRDETAGLLAAFRLNLTALSLISVFVGLFLVFSSTQASLVRRRTEFGLLRSLGATRRQLLALVVTQTAVLGALGVALGLPLGYWVAAANVDVVSGTLTNIYLLDEIEQVRVPVSLLLLASGVGIGGAVAGAVWPAIDMARRDPTALLSPYTLHEKIHDVAGLLALLGLSMLAAGGIWYATLGRHWQPAGFVLAVVVLGGLPLLTPLVVRWTSTPVRASDFALRFSIRSLAVRLQSTSVAVASLAVAVSMLAGITIMIGSFRRTLEVWVDATVQADVYVTSESWARSVDRAPLDSQLVTELASTPGVVAVDRLRGFLGYTGDHRIFIAGVDTRSARSDTRFLLLDGEPKTALALVASEDAILISEPLARKTNRWAGDSLSIVGPVGPTRFHIAGVRYDYGNDAGSVIMDLATLDARFGPGPINSVALYLDLAVDVEQAVDRLKSRFRDSPLLIRSNRLLRAEVMDIFDQTFAITRILQAMCLLVAACGITLTLLILARERVSELALYRALGASRAQIFSVFLGKGTFMGVLGMVLGAVGGVILAAILIFVVNRAYFGWTVQVSWPISALLGQGATILAVAIAASLYPAFRAARVPATELSREDV